MGEVMNAGDSSAQWLLSSRVEPRPLMEALLSIANATKKGREVVFTSAARGGLRMTIEEVGCLQASVLFRKDAFASFEASPALEISVNLTVLTDALQLFLSDSGKSEEQPIRMFCEASGDPLILSAGSASNQPSSFTLSCNIRTLSEPVTSDFHFGSVPILNTAILQSDALREALAELDYAGAAVCEIRLGPQKPRFRLESGDANTGYCLAVELPDPEDPSSRVFSDFKSSKLQVCCYRLQLLQRCLKALSLSDTTKIRMNSEGMLSLAVKLKSFPSGGEGFVEFTMVAEEIDVDSD